jgi:hypothetical protein
MPYREFLVAHRDGTLDQRAEWRAYDIPKAVNAGHVSQALRALGFGYSGELALATFMAQYGVPTVGEADDTLGAWWVYTRVASGRRVVGLQRRSPGGLDGGGG